MNCSSCRYRWAFVPEVDVNGYSGPENALIEGEQECTPHVVRVLEGIQQRFGVRHLGWKHKCQSRCCLEIYLRKMLITSHLHRVAKLQFLFVIQSKARQGKFIYKAQFVHKAIQSALQLYKIRRRQIKSFHKK